MNLSPIDYNNLSQCVEVVYQQPSLWYVAIPLFIGLIFSVLLFVDIYLIKKDGISIRKQKIIEWFAWIIFICFLSLSLILNYFFI